MSGDSDMEYSSDNECEYDDYYNIGQYLEIVFLFKTEVAIRTYIYIPMYMAKYNVIRIMFTKLLS